MVATTGAISRAKLQSNHHHQQTNTQFFFTGRMPFLLPNQQCQSIEGKISHSMDLLTPNSPEGLPTLSLTTNSSWLPWETFAMPLISPLMPVPQTTIPLTISIKFNMHTDINQYKKYITAKSQVQCAKHVTDITINSQRTDERLGSPSPGATRRLLCKMYCLCTVYGEIVHCGEVSLSLSQEVMFCVSSPILCFFLNVFCVPVLYLLALAK